MGGCAVHLHVSETFKGEMDHPSLGSRDIGSGVCVKASWDRETFEGNPPAKTFRGISNEFS